MTSSQFLAVEDAAHAKPNIAKNLSKGYADFGPVHIPTPTVYFAEYPAGAIFTTPADNMRLLLAYSNGGKYNGYQLLKPETVRLMLSPQLIGASGITAENFVVQAALGLIMVLARLWKTGFRFWSFRRAHAVWLDGMKFSLFRSRILFSPST